MKYFLLVGLVFITLLGFFGIFIGNNSIPIAIVFGIILGQQWGRFIAVFK